MIKRIKYKPLLLPAILLTVIFSFGSCKQDELGPSIFDTTDYSLDSTSSTYAFDKYLHDNFLVPYNLSFQYKLKDVSADMSYNLVPASLQNAEKLAVLAKYLWFEVYDKMAGPDFLKEYGPRMIQLIGSPAYNPASGTMLLGLAEGGIKISLFRVNELDVNNVDQLNEYYFKTMHHEFGHILHQTKNYPTAFNLISYKNYDPYSWQERDPKIAWSLGFVSPYASSQTREDWVETIANYIVKTDAQWNTILTDAAKEWVVDPTTGKVVETTTQSDGVQGDVIIKEKLAMCKEWFKTDWNINLDSLRAEVQYRQSHINMDSLLAEIHK